MTYPLVNIVTIAVRAVIRGADDFVAIATWVRLQRDWLATILDLEAGIPSHTRFNAIFQALDPGAFEKCLLGWIAALREVTAARSTSNSPMMGPSCGTPASTSSTWT